MTRRRRRRRIRNQFPVRRASWVESSHVGNNQRNHWRALFVLPSKFLAWLDRCCRRSFARLDDLREAAKLVELQRSFERTTKTWTRRSSLSSSSSSFVFLRSGGQPTSFVLYRAKSSNRPRVKGTKMANEMMAKEIADLSPASGKEADWFWIAHETRAKLVAMEALNFCLAFNCQLPIASFERMRCQ